MLARDLHFYIEEEELARGDLEACGGLLVVMGRAIKSAHFAKDFPRWSLPRRLLLRSLASSKSWTANHRQTGRGGNIN